MIFMKKNYTLSWKYAMWAENSKGILNEMMMGSTQHEK